MISNRSILDSFALKFAKIVEKHTDYIIVSGFVVISSGRARATEDIDMIIRPIGKDKFAGLHKELGTNGFECIQYSDSNEVWDQLQEFLPVRYVQKGKPLPEMEMKFAKDELDEYQMETRTKLKLTGLDLWFSNVNVNIAFKEYLLKSPKDIEDAKHLRIVYEEMVDEKEINKVRGLIRKCRL